jgi:hypothetical protein
MARIAFAAAWLVAVGLTASAQDTSKPKSLSDTAKSIIDQRKSALDKSTQQKNDAAKGFSGVIGSTQKSAIPNDQPLTLAPNAKEIMAKREVPLNKKEAAVMTSLGKTMTVDFTGKNLRQVIDYLSSQTGLTILPDPASLKEAGADLEDQVNFKSPGPLSVRAILRKVLADRGLSYIVTENGVDVVTIEKARQATVVRVYPIGDLVQPIRPIPQFVYDPFTGRLMPALPGQVVTPQQIAGQQIVEIVKSSVDPSYWAPAGPGTVTFHEATGALIVRASAEIQFQIGQALYKR